MNKLLFFFIFTFSSYPFFVHAQELDMRYFSKLPIQHEGRIKPLESYARLLAAGLGHKNAIHNQNAINFLAAILFDPSDLITNPAFLIKNKHLKEILDLDRETNSFSLTEIILAIKNQEAFLQNILQKDRNEWDTQERDLIELYDTAATLKGTLITFQAFLPLRIDLPEPIRAEIGIKGEESLNYMTLKRHEEDLDNYLGTLPKNNLSEDMKLFMLQLSLIEQNSDNNNIFRIMPPEWPVNQTQEWNTPWILINNGLAGPKSSQYLELWQEMAKAYREKNKTKWLTLTQEALEESLSFSFDGTTKTKLSVEVSYLQLTPYFYALLFYIFGAFIALAIMLRPDLPLNIVAGSTLFAGVCFHTSAIVMRVIILERPPVSTLYESVIFVSLICVIVSLILACLSKEKTLALLLGALCGIVFYFVASYLALEGDTLQVLTAVLNTNFWLATHVIIITAGYGLCVLTALLAHYYLFAQAFTSKQVKNLPALALKFALISLLLTSVGTILGGIWADQSWGRFWGWDPKENGALLIVLWLVWAIHGKIAGQLKDLGFMITLGFLASIVALAWFGVNLLSVGLHSYGFINGIAYGLTLFCLIEIILLATPALMIMKRRKENAA